MASPEVLARATALRQTRDAIRFMAESFALSALHPSGRHQGLHVGGHVELPDRRPLAELVIDEREHHALRADTLPGCRLAIIRNEAAYVQCPREGVGHILAA